MQPNIKVLQIELETFWSSGRSNLCQIAAYLLPVIDTLRSPDDLIRFCEPTISFPFFAWQILLASISTEYNVSIFFNVATLFDQM